MVINNCRCQRRQTIQKLKILEFLRSVKSHPTAEIVYNHVKKELPMITLATVYRNLNNLAQDKEILRLEINGEYHYDADISKHQHCFCHECGKVIDDFSESKKVNDFNVEQVTFYGTCKKCGVK
jgi:Fe2+ or Zn2+ uptake regulation protein